MLFFKDSLELHSLKTGNLEVVPYFCTEDSEGFCFLSFALGADKGVLNRSTGNSLCSADRQFALKVHKREKFFSSDFEFFTILYLVKLKY
jgi:hypothetical protein